MSGGSHEYVCFEIENELCEKMHDAELNDLMNDIVKIAHDLEWYDSGDYSEDTYRKAVSEFKKKWFETSRKERLKRYIDESLEKQRKELYSLIGFEKGGVENG